MAAPSTRIRLSFENFSHLFGGPNPSCWFLVDTTSTDTVQDLAVKIKRRFNIPADLNIALRLDGFLVPSQESVHILRDNDHIRVRINAVLCETSSNVGQLPNQSLHHENLVQIKQEPGHGNSRFGPPSSSPLAAVAVNAAQSTFPDTRDYEEHRTVQLRDDEDNDKSKGKKKKKKKSTKSDNFLSRKEDTALPTSAKTTNVKDSKSKGKKEKKRKRIHSSSDSSDEEVVKKKRKKLKVSSKDSVKETESGNSKTKVKKPNKSKKKVCEIESKTDKAQKELKTKSSRTVQKKKTVDLSESSSEDDTLPTVGLGYNKSSGPDNSKKPQADAGMAGGSSSSADEMAIMKELGLKVTNKPEIKGKDVGTKAVKSDSSSSSTCSSEDESNKKGTQKDVQELELDSDAERKAAENAAAEKQLEDLLSSVDNKARARRRRRKREGQKRKRRNKHSDKNGTLDDGDLVESDLQNGDSQVLDKVETEVNDVLEEKSQDSDQENGAHVENDLANIHGKQYKQEKDRKKNQCYNMSKEEQLQSIYTNVSFIYENPEVYGDEDVEPEPPKDYTSFQLLDAPPKPGEKIAYKVLEISDNYTPEVSEYKEGELLSYDPNSRSLVLKCLTKIRGKNPRKFDIITDDYDTTQSSSEEIVHYDWSTLIEPRLLS